MPASGNKILIASPRNIELRSRKLLIRARSVSSRLSLRHDISEVVERNVRAPGNDGVAGRLLTDAELVDPARR